MEKKNRIAIFGASGSIGQSLAQWFSDREWDVLALSRTGRPPKDARLLNHLRWFPCDPDNYIFPDNIFDENSPLNAVVWAQGQNLNDSIYRCDLEAHEKIYRANVIYILKTMGILLRGNNLSVPSRFCIISSIWQNLARQNKLSYTITKAALQGLVLSASLDLGQDGHLINAVLPGAIETPMTRANLKEGQIKKIEKSTYFNRLSTLEDVCSIVEYLCSPANTGITGQFITADLGFSRARII